MTLEEETETALRNASPEELKRVVVDALGHAQKPYASVGSLLQSTDGQSTSEEARARAMYVLSESRELGVAALLEAQGLGTEGRAWQITMAAEGVLELERELLRWMRRELSDRTPLPARAGEPKRRVCDEAYLAVPRVMTLPEDHPARAHDRAGFLGLPVWRRDTLIRELVKSRPYRRILGEIV